MTIVLLARTAQHHAPVVLVRAAGPELRSAHAPAAICARPARLDGGQVTSSLLLAHADRERHLAAADRRQEALALGLCAVAQNQRSGLPVGHPVVANRRPPA